MQYRTLAQQRKVSALCLGAMNFGATIDPETSTAILDRFVEAGGTFIDTANNYGQWYGHPGAGTSEKLLGGWLRSRGNRDQVVIATKCGAKTTVPGDPSDEHWDGLAAATIQASVKDSLANLGVDRIDLYYAHIDNRATPLEETVAAFGQLAADGVVDVIGCSNTAAWRLERARWLAEAQGVAKYSVLQQHYTYLWPKPIAPGRMRRRLGTPHYNTIDVEHLDYLSEHRDVTLVAHSPLLGGSYSRPDRPFEVSVYAHPSAQVRYGALRQVASELGATVNQVVLAWMLHQDPVVIPLFGASSVAQLDEALEAVDLELSAEVLERLDNA